jgi:hypothetical protein
MADDQQDCNNDFKLELTPRYVIDKNNKDFYPTPGWCTRALLNEHPPPIKTIIEPSAGEGHIVRQIVQHARNTKTSYLIDAFELREECRQPLIESGAYSVTIEDWFSAVTKISLRRFSIIGNPPFGLALEFAQSCLATSAQYVALLLKLSFLATEGRVKWNNDNPVTALYPLGKRPSFTMDGHTDSSDYAWFVWDKTCGPQYPKVLMPLPGDTP